MPAKRMSLTKCPPSIILINPKNRPTNKDDQRKKLFFVTKYRTIKEKPTEASPETKEQFVLHALEYSYHAVKFSCPPSCKISLGLTLPQFAFKT